MKRRPAIVIVMILASACGQRDLDTRSSAGVAATSLSVPSASASSPALVDELRTALLDKQPTADLEREIVGRGRGIVPDLAKALDDPFSIVNRTAADLLEQIGGEDALDALVGYALRLEQMPGAPPFASEGFGRLVRLGKATWPAILRRYKNDANPVDRAILLQIVQHIGVDADTAPIIEAALADRDDGNAAVGSWMLGKMKSPTACKALLERLDSKNILRRAGAISGLRLLGDGGAIPALLDVASEPRLQVYPDPMIPTLLVQRSSVQAEALFVASKLTQDGAPEDAASIRGWMSSRVLGPSQCPRRGASKP